MAKDYMIPDATMDELCNAYRFYRECGDRHDRALEHACIVVRERKVGTTWMIPWLMRHMVHGRCGGNADQALSLMLGRIAIARMEYDT